MNNNIFVFIYPTNSQKNSFFLFLDVHRPDVFTIYLVGFSSKIKIRRVKMKTKNKFTRE